MSSRYTKQEASNYESTAFLVKSATLIVTKVLAGKSYSLPRLPPLVTYALLCQHSDLLAKQCDIQEPFNYKQASGDPICVQSMVNEIEALEKNPT